MIVHVPRTWTQWQCESRCVEKLCTMTLWQTLGQEPVRTGVLRTWTKWPCNSRCVTNLNAMIMWQLMCWESVHNDLMTVFESNTCYSRCAKNLGAMILWQLMRQKHGRSDLWKLTRKNLDVIIPLQWRLNEHDSVSNHQRLDCLINRLFRPRWKKTSKLRVPGLCEGNSPVAEGSIC